MNNKETDKSKKDFAEKKFRILLKEKQTNKGITSKMKMVSYFLIQYLLEKTVLTV
jgi:hypothetical protein